MLLCVGCVGATPAPSAEAAPVAGVSDEEPVAESDWSTASVGAILRETARRSCLQQNRCRSYLCMPIGAITEVCHPVRVEPRIAEALAELEQGTKTFDRERALRILDELADTGPCRDQDFSPACDAGIDRTLEALRPESNASLPREDGDEDCRSSGECREGRICSIEEGCVAPLPAGAPCGPRLGPSHLSSCADGLVCTHHGCDIGGAIGAECSNGRSELDPCRQGLACRDQHCVQVGDPWGDCGTDDRCPESFGCAHGRCMPLPMVGEACDDECVDGVCADGTCAPVPLGQPCVGAIFGGRRCAEGRCDQVRDVCRVR